MTPSPKPPPGAPWREADTVGGTEMLDGQRQTMDIPTHARAAHNGPLEKTLAKDLC